MPPSALIVKFLIVTDNEALGSDSVRWGEEGSAGVEVVTPKIAIKQTKRDLTLTQPLSPVKAVCRLVLCVHSPRIPLTLLKSGSCPPQLRIEVLVDPKDSD